MCKQPHSTMNKITHTIFTVCALINAVLSLYYSFKGDYNHANFCVGFAILGQLWANNIKE